MLSSDKNVETLERLIKTLKDYIGLQKEYLKLDVIDKSIRLIAALALTAVVFVLACAVLFFLSFAVVYWLSPYVGMAVAFVTVAVMLFVLLLFIYALRRPLIVQPLVRFITTILLGK